ncbi:MAG: zinc transporter ZupT [Muribaculaceae bacterium]|nr:zinc transporter ZupT [Muribaculaceae bacterium]
MDIDLSTVLIALGLTAIAGLSTGIGSLMVFLAKASNTKFLSLALGLSGGVMVYVSFMDLLPGSVISLSDIFSPKMASLIAILAFFAGITMIALIDFFIPEDENPHETHAFENIEKKDGSMKRTGVMLAFAIGIHNFPEGLATFASALGGLDVALPIVVAIAIHNIPEGIAVSVPIYHATGSKKKAFAYSFLSGLSEPVGAAFGALFLLPFWSPAISALLLSFVAGIMVYISFDELLPSSERYGHHHYAISGVITGMAIMAFGLLLF